MLLSIIVPVYNVSLYLRRCIDSLLDQGTFFDYEIILIDDGSTDGSERICEEYSNAYKNIVVIHKPNGGMSSARNKGLEIATGKYILFVDSDDYIRTDCLRSVVQKAEENDADMVFFNYTYITEPYGARKNETIVEFENEVITGQEYIKRCASLKTIPMAIWFKLYRADLIRGQNIYFKEGYVHEDEEWSVRVLCAARRAVYLPQNLYGYYLRNNSITHSQNSRKTASLDLLDNCKTLKEYYNKIEDQTVRCILENNTVALALSAFYKGKLTDKVDVVKDIISDMHTEGHNRRKLRAFLKAPILYYYINVTIKKIGKIKFALQRFVAYVRKVYEYLSQKFRLFLRREFVCKKQRKQLQNHTFSIISSTCNGGVITSELGEQMRSPTINLWMSAEDYLKLASNLEYYMNLDVIEKQNRFEPYPIGRLGDITLYFMHYHTFDNAKEKWETRKKRLNLNDLFFMMAEKDGCTPDMVREFDALPYAHKVIFTFNEYPDCKSAVRATDRTGAVDVGIMTDFVGLCKRRYDLCFDYIAWLNQSKDDNKPIQD